MSSVVRFTYGKSNVPVSEGGSEQENPKSTDVLLEPADLGQAVVAEEQLF